MTSPRILSLAKQQQNEAKILPPWSCHQQKKICQRGEKSRVDKTGSEITWRTQESYFHNVGDEICLVKRKESKAVGNAAWRRHIRFAAVDRRKGSPLRLVCLVTQLGLLCPPFFVVATRYRWIIFYALDRFSHSTYPAARWMKKFWWFCWLKWRVFACDVWGELRKDKRTKGGRQGQVKAHLIMGCV